VKSGRSTAAAPDGLGGPGSGSAVGWAWWVAACKATAYDEGVEGAQLDFNRRPSWAGVRLREES
jgi:hypothetical protein